MSAYNAAQALANTLTHAGVVKKAALAVTTGVATKAQLALNAAMTANPVGLVIAAIAALIAAFVGLIAIIEKLKKLWGSDNSAQEQLEASSKRAEEFSNALDNAHQKAQELKSDFDGYNEVITKLESCAKGTEEWYKQIDEVRNVVNDLLEKYPELAGYEMEYDKETGLYKFSQKAIDEVIDQRRQNELILQGAKFQEEATKAETAATLSGNTTEVESSLNSAQFSFNGRADTIFNSGINGNIIHPDDFRSLVNSTRTNGADSDIVRQQATISMLKKILSDNGQDATNMSLDEMMSAAKEFFADEGSEGGLFGWGKRDATDGTEELQEYLNAGLEITIQNLTEHGTELITLEDQLYDAGSDPASIYPEGTRSDPGD